MSTTLQDPRKTRGLPSREHATTQSLCAADGRRQGSIPCLTFGNCGSRLVARSLTWLCPFHLIKIKFKSWFLRGSSHISSTQKHMWLVAAILNSGETEGLPHCGKTYWAVLPRSHHHRRRGENSFQTKRCHYKWLWDPQITKHWMRVTGVYQYVCQSEF